MKKTASLRHEIQELWNVSPALRWSAYTPTEEPSIRLRLSDFGSFATPVGCPPREMTTAGWRDLEAAPSLRLLLIRAIGELDAALPAVVTLRPRIQDLYLVTSQHSPHEVWQLRPCS